MSILTSSIAAALRDLLKNELRSSVITYLDEGGPGSGHWGHKGRKGKKGGSASGGGIRSGLSALLEKITKARETGEGFTWRPWKGTNPPAEGFVISRSGHGKVFTETFSRKDARQWLKDQWNFAKQDPERFFGAWVDESTKKLYLDVNDVLGEKDRALVRARDTGEIAIWDLKNKEEIRA